MLQPADWGQGLAVEVLNALQAIAVSLGLLCLTARCDRRNRRARQMLSTFGMTPEAAPPKPLAGSSLSNSISRHVRFKPVKICPLCACLSISYAASLLLWHGTAQATTVLNGAEQALGNGKAHTYIVMDHANQPTELGVVLTESALSDLPTEKVELNLALPADMAGETPFTHVGLNWNPHGHMPEPIYGTPHFDFHFYTIAEAARQCITADQLEKSYVSPAAGHAPAGYVLAPDSAEVTQGAHWINPDAPEFQGPPQGFDHTFIYGFFEGQLTFLEPMSGCESLGMGFRIICPLCLSAVGRVVGMAASTPVAPSPTRFHAPPSPETPS